MVPRNIHTPHERTMKNPKYNTKAKVLKGSTMYEGKLEISRGVEMGQFGNIKQKNIRGAEGLWIFS